MDDNIPHVDPQKMKIYLEKQNKKIQKEFTGTAKELIKALKINPETIIITKNNKLITLDEKIKNDDEIRILSVISGG